MNGFLTDDQLFEFFDAKTLDLVGAHCVRVIDELSDEYANASPPRTVTPVALDVLKTTAIQYARVSEYKKIGRVDPSALSKEAMKRLNDLEALLTHLLANILTPWG